MDQSSDVSNRVLAYLKDQDIGDSLCLAQEWEMDHQALVGHLLKLESEFYIKTEVLESKRWALTKEGAHYFDHGTPEFVLLSKVPPEGIPRAELMKLVDDSTFKIGFSNAVAKKYILPGDRIARNPAKPDVVDEDRLAMGEVLKGHVSGGDVLDRLKKRKLIQQEVVKSFRAVKGANYAPEFRKKLADLSAELLKDGKWQQAQFKEINYKAKGKPGTD